MKLAALCDSLSLNPTRMHEWTATRIVLPMKPPMGRGNHAEYDDASLVAAAVALELERLRVVVRHYAESFAQLHLLLRSRSSLEWPHLALEMTTTHAALLEPDAMPATERAAIRLNMATVCSGLRINQLQQPLDFGLRSA